MQRAPGIPHALRLLGRMILSQLGRIAPRECEVVSFPGYLKIESEITLTPIPLVAFEFVMPGLVPGIPVLSSLRQKRHGWPGQARP